jgi:2-dehydrotetronate isomerase
MPKFAANLSMMFTEWEFLDRFAAAADAGFTAVEYLFPYAFKPEEISERLKRNNLVQALFNLPPGDWSVGDRGLAAIPTRRDEFRASVTIALPYAEATGVTRIHIMSGIADAKNHATMASYRDALKYVCDIASPLGLEILIEPINGRDMPGYFLNDFNTAVELITAMELPNLKLQYDIYHRQILHGDVTKSLESLLPVIGHIQTASVPNRNEPGTGELDDARIFKHIDAIGYTGFIGCEYRPANGTLNGLSWLSKDKT